MNSSPSGAPRTTTGAATLLVIACAGVLLTLTAALAVASGMVVAQRRAQTAADLVAVSAASRGCGEAAGVAARNGATLLDCRPVGADVSVTVRVSGPTAFGWRAELLGRARAGPAR